MSPTHWLIVNPVSGPPSRRLARQARLARAMHLLKTCGVVHVHGVETEGPGHAGACAAEAVRAGAGTVVVWGGDGTLNDVAPHLLDTPTALGIVPGGSGNGLARALGLPLAREAALRVAALGAPRRIDVGAVNGRVFLNLAGFGLDAAVAHRFNASGSDRRGLVTYLRSCAAEVRVRQPSRYEVSIDDQPWFTGVADLVAVGNGQQYGHGARIVPQARLDDGCLDVVAVPDVSLARVLRHGWRLFHGSIAHVPGVRAARGRTVRVVCHDPVLLHVDGEMQAVTDVQSFTVRPMALAVRVP